MPDALVPPQAASPVDIRVSSLRSPIDLTEYLFRRLHQVGVRSVHGVPGDYNLEALDYVAKTGLSWVGNVNELNAAYAADGYARIKGIAALFTTFGVGELSALNGVAGAFAEYVPVLHIVGIPSTRAQQHGLLLHHTLGTGDFGAFAGMSRTISCANANLSDAANAAELVDHAIRECYVQSRPAYITLPSDMVGAKVEGGRLETPLDISYPANDAGQEDFVVEEVLRAVQGAKNPIILVDACAVRHRALDEVHALVEESGLPTFVAPMGKGAVNETLPNYCGVYAGSASHPEVVEMVNSSDLTLSIGAIKSDFNTGGFSYRTSNMTSIDFHSKMIRVRYAEYHGCRMNGVLQKITQRLEKRSPPTQPRPIRDPAEYPADQKVGGETITQTSFWPQVGPWLRQNDIVITETGTSSYGIWAVKFPKDITAISQVLWGSIGYAHGACQGAALAGKELKKGHTVLFTGEGSFQLSAQELSTMLRLKLTPIIFILNNSGYTIERFIHGMSASYNDVAPWNYTALPAVFGAQEESFLTRQLKTPEDVKDLFADKEFAEAKRLRLVEVFMEKDDAPGALRITAEASAKNNAQQS